MPNYHEQIRAIEKTEGSVLTGASLVPLYCRLNFSSGRIIDGRGGQFLMRAWSTCIRSNAYMYPATEVEYPPPPPPPGLPPPKRRVLRWSGAPTKIERRSRRWGSSGTSSATASSGTMSWRASRTTRLCTGSCPTTILRCEHETAVGGRTAERFWRVGWCPEVYRVPPFFFVVGVLRDTVSYAYQLFWVCVNTRFGTWQDVEC